MSGAGGTTLKVATNPRRSMICGDFFKGGDDFDDEFYMRAV